MSSNSELREQNLSLITLKNGKLTAKISPFGATLVELWVPNPQGELADVVLGYDTVEEYLNCTTYFGGTIAPNANRLRPASFTVGEKEYHLTQNDGTNNLHSGPRDASKRLFEFESPQPNRVNFSINLSESDTGFPGLLTLSVTHTLTENNTIEIEYSGVSTETTIINPTNHSYFNLGGHGNICNHTLELKAGLYTPFDAVGIPTGEVLKTGGTALDFSAPRRLGDLFTNTHPSTSQGLDHNFVLDGSGYRQVATVKDPSGRVMKVHTDRPCVQIYSANGLSEEKGKNGVGYPQYGGLCLETQNVPNHIHLPWFTSSLYKGGEVFRSKTGYEFT